MKRNLYVVPTTKITKIAVDTPLLAGSGTLPVDPSHPVPGGSGLSKEDELDWKLWTRDTNPWDKDI